MKKTTVLCVLLLAAFLFLFGSTCSCEAASDIDSKLVQEEARMRTLERQISEHQRRVRQMGEREEGVISRIEELDQKRKMTEQRIRVLELRSEKTKQAVEELRKRDSGYRTGSDLDEARA